MRLNAITSRLHTRLFNIRYQVDRRTMSMLNSRRARRIDVAASKRQSKQHTSSICPRVLQQLASIPKRSYVLPSTWHGPAWRCCPALTGSPVTPRWTTMSSCTPPSSSVASRFDQQRRRHVCVPSAFAREKRPKVLINKQRATASCLASTDLCMVVFTAYMLMQRLMMIDIAIHVARSVNAIMTRRRYEGEQSNTACKAVKLPMW